MSKSVSSKINEVKQNIENVKKDKKFVKSKVSKKVLNDKLENMHNELEDLTEQKK